MNQSENLRNKVEELVNEIESTHRYSMSRIYELHNKVFGLNEQAQSCASCLIRKSRQLKAWLADESEKESNAKQEAQKQITNLKR